MDSKTSEASQKTHLEDRPRVLVVDDEPGVRQVIRVNLVMQGHEVVEAKNGAQALKVIEENGIDLVILDLMMPKVSGWDVLEAVRGRRGSKGMPIIVLSAITTEDAKVKAFDLGAADYIVKPFAVGELLARVNRTLHERKEKQVLAEFSITDWVTGLFNRRYLELRLPQEISRAHRYHTPLTAVFFEVDQLPWLMEERGPQYIDGLLQEVATLVRGETRACDVLFRYDGDYFIALLPDTELAGGLEVADRIRRRMLQTEWHQGVGISGTFGVVQLEDGEDASKFLGRAEDALLSAKRLGGNALWPAKDRTPDERLSEADASSQAGGASEDRWTTAETGIDYTTGQDSVEGYPVEESYPEPLLEQEVAADSTYVPPETNVSSPSEHSSQFPAVSGTFTPTDTGSGRALHERGEKMHVSGTFTPTDTGSERLEASPTQRIDPYLLAQVQRDISYSREASSAVPQSTEPPKAVPPYFAYGQTGQPSPEMPLADTGMPPQDNPTAESWQYNRAQPTQSPYQYGYDSGVQQWDVQQRPHSETSGWQADPENYDHQAWNAYSPSTDSAGFTADSLPQDFVAQENSARDMHDVQVENESRPPNS